MSILECKVLCNIYDSDGERDAEVVSRTEWKDYAIRIDSIVAVTRAKDNPENESAITMLNGTEYWVNLKYETVLELWHKALNGVVINNILN